MYNTCHIVYRALLQVNVFLSLSYERSKVWKNFSGEVAFRRKLRKRMCKTVQNGFTPTAGNDKRVNCVWSLFTKFKSFY